MRFIVDAQLPERLARHLVALGHEAVHVKTLPKAGDTTDEEIAAFADAQGWIVVTKDVDFADSHAARGTPRLLLHVTTGNVKNADLLALFEAHMDDIDQGFAGVDVVELSQSGVVLHR